MEVSRSLSERKPRPQKDQSLNCPRCNSTNTKFCYYNNYSLNQPRYFCKTCRRYWTEGGSLRNVPVGGGSRKNERPTSSSSKKLTDPVQHGFFPQSAAQNHKIHELQDLNLAYPPPEEDNMSKFVQVPMPYGAESRSHHQNPCSSSISSQPMSSSMELLRTGMTSRGLNSFIPIPTNEPSTIFSTGFLFQEFRPTNLNFSLEGSEGRHRSIQGEPETGARLLFPTEDLKQDSTNIEFQQNQGQGDHPIGYWNGMIGRGSW